MHSLRIRRGCPPHHNTRGQQVHTTTPHTVSNVNYLFRHTKQQTKALLRLSFAFVLENLVTTAARHPPQLTNISISKASATMPPQLTNIPTSKAPSIISPLGHKDRILTFESQREMYGDLAVNTRVSGHPLSTSTRPTDPSVTHESATLRENGQDTTVSRFLDLPRELRDMVYGYLLCDTKIIFKFLDMKVHALYHGGRRHDIRASTTLPS